MGRGKKNKRYLIVAGDGDPCPRCGKPTQIREHDAITAKHLALFRAGSTASIRTARSACTWSSGTRCTAPP
jgi:transposase